MGENPNLNLPKCVLDDAPEEFHRVIVVENFEPEEGRTLEGVLLRADSRSGNAYIRAMKLGDSPAPPHLYYRVHISWLPDGARKGHTTTIRR